ncbi:hypothetical protein DUHN25_07230 [Helicobacter pylori]|nr:hypothetical protein VN1241_02570 [Helicobacter pylori]
MSICVYLEEERRMEKYIQSSILRFENQSKNFSLASKHKQEYKLSLQEIEITDEIPF